MADRSEGRGVMVTAMAIVTGLLGLVLLALGLWLAALGGSIYYLLAGVALLATGWLLWRRRGEALVVYALLLGATLVWALFESGFDLWRLAPRGDLLFPIGILLITPWVVRRLGGDRVRRRTGVAALGVALAASAVVLVVALLSNPTDVEASLPTRAIAASAPAGIADADWPAYGRSWRGDKYSPLAQLTPANVGGLKPAWSIHTGDVRRPDDPGELTYEVTPIKVGDTLYLCTPHNIVLALDPVTGHEKWRFDPRVRVSGTQHMSCRGVSYFDKASGGSTSPPAATVATQPVAPCDRRIFMATNDARLIALDAATGQLCAGFGTGGMLDLRPQVPGYTEGWYQFTSAPLVAKGLVVLGGSIYDNRSTDMPSGVIRAFDAMTGRLVWNFDPGNPGSTAPIAAGQHYVPSTPNSWSTSAADEALGLIYVPMGMGAVDQYGPHRPPANERFATTILALDIATGKPRWAFQTVHHDLWDMDVPAQPALVDLPVAGKGLVPALIQSTKTGNIFVLDRRTGAPIVPVTERPVPRGAAPGDFAAPTQPFSALSLMPSGRVEERDMWGATMLDQLMCRIAFRKLRYDGVFTPPSTTATMVYPGNFGVMDWGGVAIDPRRGIAFANPDYMAFIDRLTTDRPKDEAAAAKKGYNPNHGARFAAYLNPFLSALGLPCQAPPWGYVAGLDLAGGKVAWRHRNGTVQDQSPVPLPLKLGVPALGGPMMTGGGLAFMSSALDDYVRAYDVTSGHQLWQARLPAGGQATPMSYQGRDGRQYVVVVAGGHGTLGTKEGDNVIAYALPR